MRYLNARPLVEGLEEELGEGLGSAGVGGAIRLDVPSRLVGLLESGKVDLALCPVVDYHRSRVELEIVPVGGISCLGPTLTVRLFSRVPVERIREVHVDTDSHTSVALLGVVLQEKTGVVPEMVPWRPWRPGRGGKRGRAGSGDDEAVESMLLIGDKVVTGCPDEGRYRYQLDLGEAWYEMTGRPFVFAVWMTRAGEDLGGLAGLLRRRLEMNLGRLGEIAKGCAGRYGWEPGLAEEYLSRLMRYRVGPEEIAAMHYFAVQAHALGLLDRLRLLRIGGGEEGGGGGGGGWVEKRRIKVQEKTPLPPKRQRGGGEKALGNTVVITTDNCLIFTKVWEEIKMLISLFYQIAPV